jgi:hypothetical protein
MVKLLIHLENKKKNWTNLGGTRCLYIKKKTGRPNLPRQGLNLGGLDIHPHHKPNFLLVTRESIPNIGTELFKAICKSRWASH